MGLEATRSLPLNRDSSRYTRTIADLAVKVRRDLELRSKAKLEIGLWSHLGVAFVPDLAVELRSGPC